MIERFSFSDLRELFAKANEEKSGDRLAGIGAQAFNAEHVAMADPAGLHAQQHFAHEFLAQFLAQRTLAGFFVQEPFGLHADVSDSH